MGPDPPAWVWVYQYALVASRGKKPCGQLRLPYVICLINLQAVPESSEVGGSRRVSKQYQFNVDPDLLLAYNIP